MLEELAKEFDLTLWSATRMRRAMRTAVRRKKVHLNNGKY